MDDNQEANLLKGIPEDISEEYVEAAKVEKLHLSYPLTNIYPDSCSPRWASIGSCKKPQSVAGNKSSAQ